MKIAGSGFISQRPGSLPKCHGSATLTTSIEYRILYTHAIQNVLVFYKPFVQAKNRESGEIVALKRVRLDDDDEGVPSSALREICLLKVREP